MNKRRSSVLYILLLCFCSVSLSQVKSPSEFLGYELGSQFTRHHQVLDYFYYIAEQKSKLVEIKEYGRTYEDRPMILAFISGADNIKKLESIRMDNLKRAGLVDGAPTNPVSIVWLSYNVHGNEAVSTEASLQTLYELVKSEDSELDFLKNTVVVIDPCLNPDGRERYVNFYWENGAFPFNPDPYASEHFERWPGGRPNHYLFDLNRDWAWQSQIESKQRMKVYNEWLPHIHVDFHEQGVNSPYYFAPAAEPFHELITDFQRDFQVEIGKNHAKYFDEKGWLYFTRQVFDLLYPSYGDTYPTFNGSIGMTYEQGGSGRAGLGIIKQEGDTLTLKDRIDHHHTTGFSTIEMASKNVEKILSSFSDFFGDKESLRYKTFILKNDGNEDKMNSLKDWLDAQDIQYNAVESSSGARGVNYANGVMEKFTINSKDLIVSTDQPKATLAHVLFEPKTALKDSLTYDITAWAVPYAYGIQAYALENKIAASPYQDKSRDKKFELDDEGYAYVSKWNSMQDARLLADLWKENIKIRVAKKTLTNSGQKFDPGSFVITKIDNELISDFHSKVVKISKKHNRELHVARTGFSDQGPDLGSADVQFLPAPKIGLVSGQGTSSLAVGATWHFLEQELGYPVTLLDTDYFSRVDLAKYDILILQNGNYGSFSGSITDSIVDWVRKGGRLVLVQNAMELFKDKPFSKLSAFKNEEERKKAEKEQEKRIDQSRLISYEAEERDFLRRFSPGAIFKVRLDNSHPLAFGYSGIYYTLKTSTAKTSYLEGGNVGIIENKDQLVSGFAGQYAKEDTGKTLVFGVEQIGRGDVVYMVDNPLFRSFWQNGKLLFTNALFWKVD